MNRRILLVSALGVAPALVVLALGATFGAVVITFRALDVATESKRAILEKDADAIIANIDERERDVHAAINEQAARYTELEMLLREAPKEAPKREAERTDDYERPEDRRTWASYDPEPQNGPLALLPAPTDDKPISDAKLDAMLPAIPY